ncbi:superoxide dismutase, copper/zinc binding [Streptomyces sp. SPB074]|nr:superoxide dismutase, copper/zinc binding [Streptomyces sp. SPB074]
MRPAVQGVRAGAGPADAEPVTGVVPLRDPALTGTGDPAPAAPGTTSAGERPAGTHQLVIGTRFAPVPQGLAPGGSLPRALTYRPALVPAGAGVQVEQHTDEDGTRVTLRATGLRAGHSYRAHVHTGLCGADPAAAGGHYQHAKDSVTPSTDPAYANDRNEIRLSFTAGTGGEGTATVTHPWGFRPGEARSVVLHEGTGMGEPAACVSVPFRGW